MRASDIDYGKTDVSLRFCDLERNALFRFDSDQHNVVRVKVQGEQTLKPGYVTLRAQYGYEEQEGIATLGNTHSSFDTYRVHRIKKEE